MNYGKENGAYVVADLTWLISDAFINLLNNKT